jgi:peptide/nickel transport system permease protein
VCVAGRALAPHDPFADDMLNTLQPPDIEHWFGTDQLGRDVFSRVIFGARDMLVVAPLATLLGLASGTGLGLLLGYVGGWLDMLLGRILDAVMAMPLIVLAMLALVALGPSQPAVVLVIGFVYTPLIARTVRAAVISQRGLDYVTAARLSGAGHLSIMLREILPNIAGPVLVEGLVRLGYAFFSVATLSFLGLGIQPPSADWGLAIADSYSLIAAGYWWIVAFNAAAIISLVVATHLAVDGILQLERNSGP